LFGTFSLFQPLQVLEPDRFKFFQFENIFAIILGGSVGTNLRTAGI